MAAPHVAGAAALYLEGDPAATAGDVYQALFVATTKGIVSSSRTANNHLLYTLPEPGSDPGPDPEPDPEPEPEPEPEPDPEPDPDPIGLSVSAYKARGLQKADLWWTSATSTNVDIHRDGSLLATVWNSGSHTDHIDRRGGGSYTYQVCEAGTSTCSAVATASF
jgi:hypothetical protein